MKIGLTLAIIIGIIASAYINANLRLTRKVDLKDLHLQMTAAQLEKTFGLPDSQQRNSLIYILPDSSQLLVTLRDGIVSSAIVKYHRPLRIEDPQMKQLTLVQMSPGDSQNDDPSWFFAGKPSDGLIYKITKNGEVESLTWVPPFTYAGNQPKNLQVLLQDFKSQHLSNL